MSSWKLAPCLAVLNAELEQIAPGRDHASDGTIGDAAHQGTDSDHNPDKNGFVCATDRDKDLHASFTMEDVVQYVLGECRKPNNVGLDRGRLNYLIFKERIWRADNEWREEPYTGESPHTEHAHFSCEHDLNYVNDTRPWGLTSKFGDDVTKDEFMAWSREFHAKKNEGFATPAIDGIGGVQAVYQTLADAAGRTNVIMYDTKTALELLNDIKATLEAHIAGLVEGQQEAGPQA